MSDIFDIKMADYTPKPARKTYEMMIAATGIEAKRSAMFEDIARNLLVPHEMGMTTVLVKADGDHMDAGAVDLGSGNEDYVHHATLRSGGFSGKRAFETNGLKVLTSPVFFRLEMAFKFPCL